MKAHPQTRTSTPEGGGNGNVQGNMNTALGARILDPKIIGYIVGFILGGTFKIQINTVSIVRFFLLLLLTVIVGSTLLGFAYSLQRISDPNITIPFSTTTSLLYHKFFQLWTSLLNLSYVVISTLVWLCVEYIRKLLSKLQSMQVSTIINIFLLLLVIFHLAQTQQFGVLSADSPFRYISTIAPDRHKAKAPLTGHKPGSHYSRPVQEFFRRRHHRMSRTQGGAVR